MSYLSEAEFAVRIEESGSIMDALADGLQYGDCEPGPLRDRWHMLEAYSMNLRHAEKGVEVELERVQGPLGYSAGISELGYEGDG